MALEWRIGEYGGYLEAGDYELNDKGCEWVAYAKCVPIYSGTLGECLEACEVHCAAANAGVEVTDVQPLKEYAEADFTSKLWPPFDAAPPKEETWRDRPPLL